MTLEELQKSDVTKAWMAGLLKQPVFRDILDTVQREAYPKKDRYQRTQPVPGVHMDTTIAHDDHFRSGWYECIEFLKNLATGNAPNNTLPPDEEEFASEPAVLAITKEIEALKSKPSTP